VALSRRERPIGDPAYEHFARLLAVLFRSPRRACSIRLLPVARREAALHDLEAYDKLLEAARSIDWRTYLIALLGGEGGMRVGEIVALEWADIDLERRQINVRHSDWRGVLTTPKSGRGRVVALTERLVSALLKHRHLRS